MSGRAAVASCCLYVDASAGLPPSRHQGAPPFLEHVFSASCARPIFSASSTRPPQHGSQRWYPQLGHISRGQRGLPRPEWTGIRSEPVGLRCRRRAGPAQSGATAASTWHGRRRTRALDLHFESAGWRGRAHPRLHADSGAQRPCGVDAPRPGCRRGWRQGEDVAGEAASPRLRDGRAQKLSHPVCQCLMAGALGSVAAAGSGSAGCTAAAAAVRCSSTRQRQQYAAAARGLGPRLARP